MSVRFTANTSIDHACIPSARKRKAEPPASKSAQPTKKAAVSSASSSRPVVVKKESKAAPQTVKDSKSDSSFFSAPKPKPRLPSFKKSPAPPPLKKEPDPNVAQPSAVDPFQEALKDMAKGRKPSPAAVSSVANHSTVTGSSTQTPTGLTKLGKKKKVVKWAPEGQLELVKLIEKAIYDDDPVDVSFIHLRSIFGLRINYVWFRVGTQGVHSLHNVRDLDRDEGAALHAHLFEELIDWSEPQCKLFEILKAGMRSSQRNLHTSQLSSFRQIWTCPREEERVRKRRRRNSAS